MGEELRRRMRGYLHVLAKEWEKEEPNPRRMLIVGSSVMMLAANYASRFLDLKGDWNEHEGGSEGDEQTTVASALDGADHQT